MPRAPLQEGQLFQAGSSLCISEEPSESSEALLPIGNL